MEKKYKFETLKNIIIIRFTKQPNYEDFVDAVNDIAGNYPNKMRLWDINTVGLCISTEMLKKLSHFAGMKLIPTKAAVVSSTDLGFGTARMYEVFRQQDQLVTRVFRSEEEAMIWLNGPSEI